MSLGPSSGTGCDGGGGKGAGVATEDCPSAIPIGAGDWGGADAGSFGPGGKPEPPLPGALPGVSGVPGIDWSGPGLNGLGTAGPTLRAAVNGGGGGSVFLGNGAAWLRQTDLYQPLNGLHWFHQRVFSSLSAYAGTEWSGEGWWVGEMMNVTGVAGNEDDNDCDAQLDPHTTLHFTNTATGVWTTDDHFLCTLTYDGGNDEFVLRRADGFRLVFHDLNVADTAGRLKRIEDAYGNDWAFTYSGSQLDYIVVDVIDGADHKIDYSYFTSGDSNGLLQYVRVYKSTTVQASDLIGQVEYVYHSSATDAYGLEDDLMKVIVSRKATTDGDGTLSVTESHYYRYWKGAYDADTNPGTDHQLRFVLLPENADRLNTAVGDPLTQTNDAFDDYANVLYEYDSSARVRQVQERLLSPITQNRPVVIT